MVLEIIITTCQGVFIVSLCVIGLFAKKYLPSYLQQKGRNLATKEDIKEITNKIESVKTQYTKIIEELKADLSIRNEQKIRILEKRNESLLKLYEDCCELVNGKLSINLYSFLNIYLKQYQTSSNNQTSTKNYSLKILSYFINYQVSTGRLFTKVKSSVCKVILFYPCNNSSDEVTTSIINLLELINKFHQNFSKEFTKLMNPLHEIILTHLTNKSLLSGDITKINTLISDYSNNIKPDIDAISKAVNRYIVALNNYFNKLGNKQLSDQLSHK